MHYEAIDRWNSMYLEHYGVKGMKWGVRHDARRDAKEYARAKVYYGKGAGTRRKLIKETVKQKSKDPDYKREFNKALAKQNMAKHVKRAKAERHRNDAINSIKKFGRGVVNITMGNPQRAAASVVALYGVAKLTGLDKKITNIGKAAVWYIKDQTANKNNGHLENPISGIKTRMFYNQIRDTKWHRQRYNHKTIDQLIENMEVPYELRSNR